MLRRDLVDYIETMPKITRDDQARAELESTGKKRMKNEEKWRKKNKKTWEKGGFAKRFQWLDD